MTLINKHIMYYNHLVTLKSNSMLCIISPYESNMHIKCDEELLFNNPLSLFSGNTRTNYAEKHDNYTTKC